MSEPSGSINMKLCRICISNKKTLRPLFGDKLSSNYAKMLTAIADVKVGSNDGFPENICAKCCINLEKAYFLKVLAERSDRKLRELLTKSSESLSIKRIAFNPLMNKSEIEPFIRKSEPKWEIDIDLNDENHVKPVETIDGKANTVIRKVDPNNEDLKVIKDTDVLQLSCTKTVPTSDNETIEAEYLNVDTYNDDDTDVDYVPDEKPKKIHKPRLVDTKVFRKEIIKKYKMHKKGKNELDDDIRSTIITCYPILENGSQNKPIFLKRPPDATILKGLNESKTSNPKETTNLSHHDQQVGGMRTATPAKQREKLVCPVCGILTSTLVNHMATHEEKKKFPCSQCPKSFVRRRELTYHEKKHAGVRDLICETCGASFDRPNSLTRHKIWHKGEKRYPCNICPKRFFARDQMKRHLLSHSGYRPYKCSMCDMSFCSKHVQQNHERIHTNDAPHSCNICNKRFKTKNVLKTHLRIHSDARPYSCKVCDVSYRYKVNLNKHVLKMHGINLKFKQIHTITEDVLCEEKKKSLIPTETQVAISPTISQSEDDLAVSAYVTIHHTNET